MPRLTEEEIKELEQIKERRRYHEKIARIIEDAKSHTDDEIDPGGPATRHGNAIIRRVLERYER